VGNKNTQSSGPAIIEIFINYADPVGKIKKPL
jgi:hypothetical protein